MGSEVSIIKGKDIRENVTRAIELIGGIKDIIKLRDKVLIKPNLAYPLPPPTTTDPKVIESVIEIVKQMGPKQVILGDSSSYSGKLPYGVGKWKNEDIFKVTGLDHIAKKWNIELVDFDREEWVWVSIPNGVILKKVRVFKPVVEANVIINIPVLKMHFETLVSLGIKNFHGIIHDIDKVNFHRDELSQKLVDIHKVIRSSLTVIDGIRAMEGLGPRMGSAVEMDLVIASKDVVAADAVASEVMGVKAWEVETTRLAQAQGLGVSDPKLIQIRGEAIDKVKKRLRRPNIDIAGVYPGITVIQGGTCRHCFGRARIFLDTLKSSGIPNNGDIRTVLIGVAPKVPQIEEIDGNLLIVGDCAIFAANRLIQQLASRAVCLTGCPPIPSVHKALNELKTRYSRISSQ